MNEEIEHNYFYLNFRREYLNILKEVQRNKIQDNEYENEWYESFIMYVPTKEEQISIFDKGLFETCINYISLSKSNIIVLPNNSIELLDLILENIQCNPYQKSFLMSLQYIFQDYFAALKRGAPILFSSEEDINPSFQVTLDSNYQMTQFEAINMDLVEQNKIILRILTLEKNNQIGPVPNVEYIYRKDI